MPVGHQSSQQWQQWQFERPLTGKVCRSWICVLLQMLAQLCFTCCCLQINCFSFFILAKIQNHHKFTLPPVHKQDKSALAPDDTDVCVSSLEETAPWKADCYKKLAPKIYAKPPPTNHPPFPFYILFPPLVSPVLHTVQLPKFMVKHPPPTTHPFPNTFSSPHSYYLFSTPSAFYIALQLLLQDPLT